MKRRKINSYDMTPFQLWYYSNRLDKFFYSAFNNLFIALGFIGIFGEIVFAIKFAIRPDEIHLALTMFKFCGLLIVSGVGFECVEKIHKYFNE